MTDVVALRGLRVDCVIGVNPDERVREQPLVIDVEMTVDVRKAGATDDLQYTVDYASLARAIPPLLRARKFVLIEAAAEAIAALALEDRRVRAVRVVVAKPDALAGAGVPSVEVARRPQARRRR